MPGSLGSSAEKQLKFKPPTAGRREHGSDVLLVLLTCTQHQQRLKKNLPRAWGASSEKRPYIAQDQRSEHAGRQQDQNDKINLANRRATQQVRGSHFDSSGPRPHFR